MRFEVAAPAAQEQAEELVSAFDRSYLMLDRVSEKVGKLPI